MIRLRNVTKKFGSYNVLRGVDLDVARGDRVALVGANGAGKTTLIRCLLGEYIADGEVLVNGSNPRLERKEVLSKIGFVPQLPPPLKMPVAQLVRFVSSVCDADSESIRSVAEKLGFDIDHFRHQPFWKLSGGQKQKLLISIAFGRDVSLLVLDEPAANLDPEARSIFFRLLAERQERAAMLISSHRLDEVATLVNRVVEMDQGVITLDDRVEDKVGLESALQVHIVVNRADAAFDKAIRGWGFDCLDKGLTWEGRVAGPDRLRFLGMLSRYAALLASIHLDEKPVEVPVKAAGSV